MVPSGRSWSRMLVSKVCKQACKKGRARKVVHAGRQPFAAAPDGSKHAYDHRAMPMTREQVVDFANEEFSPQ